MFRISGWNFHIIDVRIFFKKFIVIHLGFRAFRDFKSPSTSTHMPIQTCLLGKAFVTHITIVSNIFVYSLDVCIQTCLLGKAFVTHITIVSNILMYTFDVSVQICLLRKAVLTLVTIVSNILMYTFDMSFQVNL